MSTGQRHGGTQDGWYTRKLINTSYRLLPRDNLDKQAIQIPPSFQIYTQLIQY